MNASTFFHASNHEFDRPDYDKMAALMTGHPNGRLGLWIANCDDWIHGFGRSVYEVNIDGKAQNLSIDQLSSWNNEDDGNPDFYVNLRNQFLSQNIDVLHLVELNGKSEMSIVINFDAITRFELMSEVQSPRPERASCK